MQLKNILLSSLAASAVSAAAVAPRQTTSCTNPSVRKEWRELSTDEKAEYIRAAVCVRNLPRQKYTWNDHVTTRMDDLVYTHFSLNTAIHFVANFLPWHRWFVQFHEDLLRNECGFKGIQPYWDWTIDADAKNFPGSPVFDPVTGFGGDGVRTNSTVPGFTRCVVDGPFANTNLTLSMGWPDINTVDDRLHCFTRAFNSALGYEENGDPIPGGDNQVGAYNSNTMNTIYGMETYASMSNMLEGLPHAQIHSVIFGDMGPATSPNEPLFMLHHANVDRVWAKWQGRNATRLADYTGFNDQSHTQTAHLDDFMPINELYEDASPTVREYMDVQGGKVCYTYSSM